MTTDPDKKTKKQLKEEEAAEAHAALQRVLGITSEPTYVTLPIPLERLYVPNEDEIKNSAAFAENIGLIGVLNDPAVIIEPGHDPQDPATTFTVVAGRRRVTAARKAKKGMIHCRVYESFNPALRAFTILSENLHRTPAWTQEVKAMAELISERVGLTDKQIAKGLGIPITRVQEMLKFARLPQPILESIYAGEISQDTARKICRLTSTQKSTLADLAGVQEVTAELVEDVLHQRINDELAPLQEVLADLPLPPVVEEEPVDTSMFHHDYEHILDTVKTWATFLNGRPGATKALMLMRALQQELAVLKRQAPTQEEVQV